MTEDRRAPSGAGAATGAGGGAGAGGEGEAGAWDCHAHVIESPLRYPLLPERGYDPPQAPLQAYLGILDRIGLERGVLVQPSVYGFDNRCLVDALQRAGGRLIGVAVPAPDSGSGALEALHRQGVRGVRCNLLNPGGLTPDAVERWQPVLRDLGWHVAVQFRVAEVGDLRSFLDRFEVPVVIDHMGRPHPGRGDPSEPGLRQLIEAVRDGACFVKLSAPYRLSARAAPWSDVTPLARALVTANPAACLWATDWPHTDTPAGLRADDLLGAFDEWCAPDPGGTPDPGVKEAILRAAPGRLFGRE